MTKLWPCFLFVATALLTGCLSSPSDRASISIHIQKITINDASGQAAPRVTLQLQLRNEDVIPYVVEKMTHHFSLEGRVRFTAVHKETVGLPNLGSADCQMSATLSEGDVRQLRALLETAAIRYSVESVYETNLFGDSQNQRSKYTGTFSPKTAAVK